MTKKRRHARTMTRSGRAEQLTAEAIRRYIGIVKQLLAAGCKPDARFFGFDPLSDARSIKCQPLIDILEAAIPPKPVGKKKK